jgi:hypothetical protein
MRREIQRTNIVNYLKHSVALATLSIIDDDYYQIEIIIGENIRFYEKFTVDSVRSLKYIFDIYENKVSDLNNILSSADMDIV